MSGKILSMHIVSYMGLQNMEIVWDKYAIMGIIADGGEGKTSIAEFLRSGLTGDFPDEAINVFTGQAKGSIKFEVDGEVVVSQFTKTKKSEVVRITFPDGSTKDGKTALKDLVGNIDINPFELKKFTPVNQVNWFKKVCKIDTREIDEKKKVNYTLRTAVNKRISTLRTSLASEKIDIAEKTERLKEEKKIGDLPTRQAKAIKLNENILLKQRDQRELFDERSLINTEVNELEREIQRLKELQAKKSLRSGEILAQQEQVVKWLNNNPPVDLALINKEIEAVHLHNRERAEFQNYLEKQKELTEGEKEALDLTKKIEDLDSERKKIITEKMVRVEGMEVLEPKTDADGNITDERQGVYYESKPISVLSTTEAIKFSMQLRRALNGNSLPVLILDDFESVGSKGRSELVKLCQQEGYSALVTMVDPEQKGIKIIIRNDLDFPSARSEKEKDEVDHQRAKKIQRPADAKKIPNTKKIPAGKGSPVKKMPQAQRK